MGIKSVGAIGSVLAVTAWTTPVVAAGFDCNSAQTPTYSSESDPYSRRPGTFTIGRLSFKGGTNYPFPEYVYCSYDKLKDVPGPLKENIERVLKDRCGAPSGPVSYCGGMSQPDSKNTVLISHYRLSWAASGAVYRAYLTYMGPGSGQFTEPVLELEFRVDVQNDGPAMESEFDVEVALTGMRQLTSTPLPALDDPASHFTQGEGP